MIINKGFFTKTKYTLEGSMLNKSVYTFFGLFRKKSEEDECINLSDVKYIYTFKFPFFSFRKKYGVELVTELDTMYITNLTKQEVNKLVEAAKNVGAEEGVHQYSFIPSSKALRKIYRGHSILCDQFGKMMHKVYTYESNTENQVPLDSVRYFDEVALNNIPGIAFGGVAKGGNANTIEIFGLSKKDNTEVYEIITNVNPQLIDTKVAIFTSLFPLFNPSRWFSKRESLIVADWGIIHKQYNVVINEKINKSRTSVVDFDSIKSYDNQGLLFKRIQIFGQTSIVSQECFSRKAQKYIWEMFKKKNITNNLGTIYRTCIIYRWGIFGNHTNKYKIQASEDFVSWNNKNETRVLSYKNIYEYEFKKQHWYSLVGDVTIIGRRIDARSGEGGDIKMELYRVWFKKGKKLIADIESKKLIN